MKQTVLSHTYLRRYTVSLRSCSSVLSRFFLLFLTYVLHTYCKNVLPPCVYLRSRIRVRDDLSCDTHFVGVHQVWVLATYGRHTSGRKETALPTINQVFSQALLLSTILKVNYSGTGREGVHCLPSGGVFAETERRMDM